MDAFKLPAAEAGFHSSLLKDYLEGSPALRSFYKFSPALPGVPDVVEERRRFTFHRETLVTELKRQHADWFSRFPVLEDQADALLSENTFTITTGHQLCLATGPLFFLYKIVTTINVCRQLNAKHPDLRFIPVFWMATEDHDLDEIRQVDFPDAHFKWETVQQGATGRMLADGMEPFLAEMESNLSNAPFAADWLTLLRKAYTSTTTLAEATRHLVLELFAAEGLLVLDADVQSLKRIFIPLMREDLSLLSSGEIVRDTSSRLEKLYKVQATPRDINLFYMDEGLRERLVKDEYGVFHVLNTELQFTRDQLLELLERFPERFSPNVILRPLYQEMILPNIATIGGPGEINYWLQLKDLFDHHRVAYPLLLPRCNGLLLLGRQYRKFNALGFSADDVFTGYEQLVQRYLATNAEGRPDFEEAKASLKRVFDELQNKVSVVDPTLGASVQAECQKSLNGIDTLSKKTDAALKRKYELVLHQLRQHIDRIRPGGVHQERVLNGGYFIAQYGPSFIKDLVLHLEPLDAQVTVLVSE
jgi:bacillithiol biosynthesis cysteine-adding enzyme BshC